MQNVNFVASAVCAPLSKLQHRISIRNFNFSNKTPTKSLEFALVNHHLRIPIVTCGRVSKVPKTVVGKVAKIAVVASRAPIEHFYPLTLICLIDMIPPCKAISELVVSSVYPV